jgi:hypothetical protein
MTSVADAPIRALRELVEINCRTYPHLTSRLEKAAFLVLLRSVSQMEPDHYQVGSEDGLRSYDIRHGHCDCGDYARHAPGHPCKHRLAVALHLALETGTQDAALLATDPDLKKRSQL